MIRTIITPDTKTISIDLPEDYLGKKIEVIAFATDEGLEKTPSKTMGDFWGIISKETADKWNNDVQKSKEEWERDI